jgi:hypothetical protein
MASARAVNIGAIRTARTESSKAVFHRKTTLSRCGGESAAAGATLVRHNRAQLTVITHPFRRRMTPPRNRSLQTRTWLENDAASPAATQLHPVLPTAVLRSPGRIDPLRRRTSAPAESRQQLQRAGSAEIRPARKFFPSRSDVKDVDSAGEEASWKGTNPIAADDAAASERPRDEPSLRTRAGFSASLLRSSWTRETVEIPERVRPHCGPPRWGLYRCGAIVQTEEFRQPGALPYCAMRELALDGHCQPDIRLLGGR